MHIPLHLPSIDESPFTVHFRSHPPSSPLPSHILPLSPSTQDSFCLPLRMPTHPSPSSSVPLPPILSQKYLFLHSSGVPQSRPRCLFSPVKGENLSRVNDFITSHLISIPTAIKHNQQHQTTAAAAAWYVEDTILNNKLRNCQEEKVLSVTETCHQRIPTS
jgi:hypothetical protein